MVEHGISSRVLTEVAYLNRRYLRVARVDAALRETLKQCLDECHWAALLAADDGAIARIANVPYLLFDLAALDPLLEPGARQPNLGATPGANELTLLALSFAHQLNLRNSFSVRVITGADSLWCEALASLPLESLADLAAAMPLPLMPALADVPGYWNTLLRAVGNDNADEIAAIRSLGLQHSIQHTAMQTRGQRLVAARRRQIGARLTS